jgi:hypothetical protein
MKAKQKKRQRLRREVDRYLHPLSEQAKLWKKLGTVDLSTAFQKKP